MTASNAWIAELRAEPCLADMADGIADEAHRALELESVRNRDALQSGKPSIGSSVSRARSPRN